MGHILSLGELNALKYSLHFSHLCAGRGRLQTRSNTVLPAKANDDEFLFSVIRTTTFEVTEQPPGSHFGVWYALNCDLGWRSNH